jgi:O-antigen ligase
LLPIFLGLSIFILKKKFFTSLFALVFILSEVLIFLSGDRTAFFYLNLSAFFVLFLSQRLVKIRLLILISSFLLIVIISFINPTAKIRLVDYTLDQMNLLNKKKDEPYFIFSVEHTNHYTTAYKMFLDNKVLGVGVKNFRNFCSDEKYYKNKSSCSTHPHNTYIQILAETGIIGFLFLIIVLFYFCKYVFKHLFLRFNGKYFFTDFQICILSGVAIYLWPFIPTGNVFNNWLNIIMILNFPFLIWKRNKNYVLKNS